MDLNIGISRELFIPPETRLVPAGAFLMGSENGLPDERPVHAVVLDAFELAIYPVTNREYRIFLESTDSPPPSEWSNPLFNQPSQPVVSVTWHEARAYCQWLSDQSGTRYRLPTEAEREKAGRGGLEGSDYPWGEGIPETRPVRSTWNQKPDPVGKYPANGYGFYDLEGNVHEWCLDWYDLNYYSNSPKVNPKGAARGERKSSRGGAWRHSINISRCSARSSLPPDYRYNDYGFRIVREIIL